MSPTPQATPDLPPPAFERYGVGLTELGEDGDYLIAFGHHEPRRFVAAANAYERIYTGNGGIRELGITSYEDVEANIRHVQGTVIFTLPHEYPEWDYYVDWSGNHPDGVFESEDGQKRPVRETPLTVWTRF